MALRGKVRSGGLRVTGVWGFWVAGLWGFRCGGVSGCRALGFYVFNLGCFSGVY